MLSQEEIEKILDRLKGQLNRELIKLDSEGDQTGMPIMNQMKMLVDYRSAVNRGMTYPTEDIKSAYMSIGMLTHAIRMAEVLLHR